MEVEVRLIILMILYVVITAQEDTSKADLTDKLLYHCAWCLRNISSAACSLLGNSTLSCIRCKKNVVDSLLCETCPALLESNPTGVHESCDTCLCNGTIDAIQLTGCNDVSDGRCFFCQSNWTVSQCRPCMDSEHGVKSSSMQSQCTTLNDKVDTKRKSEFSTKEKIIVAVCSAFGAAFLAITGSLVYRHYKSRRFSIKKPFWTVELTNRNYDDLDFSLLNPITDVPFVYRTDVGEFDNEALLASEKPQLVMDVDTGNAVS